MRITGFSRTSKKKITSFSVPKSVTGSPNCEQHRQSKNGRNNYKFSRKKKNHKILDSPLDDIESNSSFTKATDIWWTTALKANEMMQNYNKYKFMSKNIIYVEKSILKLKLLECVPLAWYNIIINHDWGSLHSLAPVIQGEWLRPSIQKGFSF